MLENYICNHWSKRNCDLDARLNCLKMGQKSLLVLLYFLVIHGAEATLVLKAPAEAVPVGRNATYQCSTSVEENEVKWAVQTPDGTDYNEANLGDIEELERVWNIYLVPHPSDRDQFHNITLIAVATEENNNTNIICQEFDSAFIPTVVSSKTEKLITIGTEGPTREDPSTEEPTHEDSTMCLDPDDIGNGMVILTGNAINDTASYTCNSGFELIGSATVTCTQMDENSAAFSPASPQCRSMLVLEAPEAVPVGRNATYRCTTVETNEVKWAVLTPDGTPYRDEEDLTLVEELETKWNIFFDPHPSVRPLDQLHNITLVAVATEENNNTNITCQEFDNPSAFFPIDSKTEKLVTIGPPLAPAPTVEARNDTAVQVSWQEPFIWEGYTIDSYVITVENTSSGKVRHETVNATSIIIYDEGIAVTCAIFNVSARSILGSSKPGVVTSGFPIGLFNDTTVNVDVVFKQSDLTPKVTVEFELPSACSFEMANYAIFIWENGSESETLTFGPNKHSYSNGRSVTREIPFNSSEPDLARDTEYLMIIDVTTSAGTSTSGMINFGTVGPNEDPIGIEVIVGIAVGTSIVAIFVLCLLMVVATAVVQRKKKRRVVVNVREMVDNPIYVGDEEEEEKYENIEGYQPTFITGLIGAAPYAVTGPPPALPEPRKGKECENLAEDGTADRLSKVSAGDEQNVYVKSEC